MSCGRVPLKPLQRQYRLMQTTLNVRLFTSEGEAGGKAVHVVEAAIEALQHRLRAPLPRAAETRMKTRAVLLRERKAAENCSKVTLLLHRPRTLVLLVATMSR
jgi:hypothetical protein